jgi:hypothetical protein
MVFQLGGVMKSEIRLLLEILKDPSIVTAALIIHFVPMGLLGLMLYLVLTKMFVPIDQIAKNTEDLKLKCGIAEVHNVQTKAMAGVQ